ncbi:MAG: DUF3604 domain-containing protein [Myxococcota bacterium]
MSDPTLARTLLGLLGLLMACSGSELDVGEIAGGTRTRTPHARADSEAASAAGIASEKTILFGDLHVHTTFSIDAYLYGLPIFGGEGAHPPADACDFARYCAELDFFSLNDHAEGLTPARWRASIESLRACDARAGDPANPDLVPFMGWEWTQTNPAPEDHEGHKNVVFPGLGEDDLPTRPISALADNTMARARGLSLARGAEALLSVTAPHYADFLYWVRQLAGTPFCEPGVDTRTLPDDCHENAPTAAILFEKLDQWGLPSLVIPHGTAWGIHAPPGASFATQLAQASHDPKRQRLLEVFSGHGASERYAPAAAKAEAVQRAGGCAEPTAEFLPCCWQAGEIVRARCDDPTSEACAARVAEARQRASEAGRRPHWVLPDTEPADWLDCDQDRGAWKSALTPRPGMSAQAALASHATDVDGNELRFRFGLIGSSDIHTARAGSGYKQVRRKGMTDVRGFASERAERWLTRFVHGRPRADGGAVESSPARLGFRGLLDVGRTSSFLYPGGLVAVHAEGRDRANVWDALERREAYGTSGPRLLLWFDLLNGPEGRAPMGSVVAQRATPAFEVRAIGSRIQLPGCPDETRAALSESRITRLCLGECHHPGEARHPIEAIEIVRITPSADPATLTERIEDPWLRFECPGDPAGCTVRFEDPAFGDEDRVYYARALQAPTPAINGAGLRTRFDAAGNATGVTPCYGGWRTPRDEDCLAPGRERAWSSPLFLDVDDVEAESESERSD